MIWHLKLQTSNLTTEKFLSVDLAKIKNIETCVRSHVHITLLLLYHHSIDAVLIFVKNIYVRSLLVLLFGYEYRLLPQ